LQRGRQRALRFVQVALGVQRGQVGVDDLCHFFVSRLRWTSSPGSIGR
jgi:hypothetical protein